MNTSKSLDELLYDLLEAHDVLPYGRGCDKNCTDMHVDEATLKATAQAIVEAVLEIIGEDEKPVPAVPGTGRRSHTWQGYRSMELFRNGLREELRQKLADWKGSYE